MNLKPPKLTRTHKVIAAVVMAAIIFGYLLSSIGRGDPAPVMEEAPVEEVTDTTTLTLGPDLVRAMVRDSVVEVTIPYDLNPGDLLRLEMGEGEPTHLAVARSERAS